MYRVVYTVIIELCAFQHYVELCLLPWQGTDCSFADIKRCLYTHLNWMLGLLVAS